MTALPLPEKAYGLERLYTYEQHYELFYEEDPIELAEERSIRFNWDWFVSDETVFMVFLGVDIGPAQSAPDRVRASIIGEFRRDPDASLPPIEPFVHDEAPRILFPFLREVVLSLTARGPHGAEMLPVLDFGRVLAEYPFKKSNGLRLLNENPDLAAAYGLAVKRRKRARKKESPKKGRGRTEPEG